MPKLIVKSSEFAPGEIELMPGINRFGRSQANDQPLDHPAISELHCEIIVEDTCVMVRDLDSTNGTFIDRRLIKESILYTGQTLQIGPVEMELVLDEEPAHVAIPEMPAITPEAREPGMLADGYAACLNHSTRHAVWECTSCARVYCDDCIRKIRRVGGAYLKFCPACNNSCELSAWSEMVKNKKKSLLATLADKVRTSFKRTRLLLGPAPSPKSREKSKRRRK
ncbi:MAG TPA: FHA domain-containing protein [Candidatus Acidoferrum sp.]|nr:FHA domain-containing protein [Candidatus Acidoferrum sp.]